MKLHDPYIRKDLAGFPFNGKFPPQENAHNGGIYHGYKTPAQECLFYDFAVLGYDLMLKYKGKSYYFMVDEDCVWLSDCAFTAMLKRFDNGNDVLTHFLIDGQPLYQLVDKLEEYEPM